MIRRAKIRLTAFFLVVREVSADETRSALIAAGSVAGGLMVVAVVFGAVYCFIRQKRRKEKQPLPRYPDVGAMVRDSKPQRFSRSGTSTTGQTSDPARRTSGGVTAKAKAQTQHCSSPRQRRSLPFFTLRANPHLKPEMVHGGPPVYARPPQVGRPVMFLDRNGPLTTKASGGSTTQSGHENEERLRRKTRRESYKEMKPRSRSHSYSRSRGQGTPTRRHSDASGSEIMGEVILQRKDEPHVYIRIPKTQSRDDNNNPFYHIAVQNSSDLGGNNFKRRSINYISGDYPRSMKFAPELRRYSITQNHPNGGLSYNAINAASNSQSSHSEKRAKSTGEVNLDVTSTPWDEHARYIRRASDIVHLARASSMDRRSSIHGVYVSSNLRKNSNRDHSAASKSVPGVRQSSAQDVSYVDIDDIIALSRHPLSSTNYDMYEDHLNQAFIHRPNLRHFRPSTPPSEPRPPTPPFDGSDMISAHISSSDRQETFPGPSHVTLVKEEVTIEAAVHAVPIPPPPAPPLPAGNSIYRSPSSLKSNSELPLDKDTTQEKHTPARSSIVNIRKAPETLGPEGGLPFMDELKRRQRSIDEGVTLLPPKKGSITIVVEDFSSADDQRSDHNHNLQLGTDGKDSRSIDDRGSRGITNQNSSTPRRPSVVQFTEKPPEIIPHEGST